MYDDGILISEVVDYQVKKGRYVHSRFYGFDGFEFDYGEDTPMHIVFTDEPIFILYEAQEIDDGNRTVYDLTFKAVQNGEIIWKIEDLRLTSITAAFTDKVFFLNDDTTRQKISAYNTITGEKIKTLNFERDTSVVSLSERITRAQYYYLTKGSVRLIKYDFIDNNTFENFYSIEDINPLNHRSIKRTIIGDKLCIATPDFETYEPGALTVNVKVVTPDEGVVLDNDILLEGVHLVNNELPSGTLTQKRIVDVSDKYLLFARGDIDELLIIDTNSGITKARIKASGVSDDRAQGYIKDNLVFLQTRYQYLCYDVSKDRMLWQINRNPIWNYVEYEGLGYHIYFHDKHNKNLPNCEVKVYDLKHNRQEPYGYSFDGYMSKECVVPTRYGVVVVDVYREDGYYIELYKPGVSEPVYSVKSSTICTNYLKNVKLTEDGAYIELFYSFNNLEGPTKYSYYHRIDTGLLYETEYKDI